MKKYIHIFCKFFTNNHPSKFHGACVEHGVYKSKFFSCSVQWTIGNKPPERRRVMIGNTGIGLYNNFGDMKIKKKCYEKLYIYVISKIFRKIKNVPTVKFMKSVLL